MKRYFFLAAITILTLSGCGSIKVIPQQTVSGMINPADNSQTISKSGISVKVAAADPDMVNYNIESMVASFAVEIANSSDNEIAFDGESFLLLDQNRKQYYALTPEKVREIATKDTYYLLPYPYVGFYYLEDYEKAQFKNSTSSSLPYYYDVKPQDIFTKALPLETIIPNAKTSGLIYFNADLATLSEFTVDIYRKGASKSAQPEFSFPFKVIK